MPIPIVPSNASIETENVKLNQSQEPPNKLSASATPFNPSPPAVRVAPMPMNIALPPPAPGPTPWQMNMTLHPRPPSSPHSPYPTPPLPGTPNMMHPHPLPLMYSPPYTQAPSLSLPIPNTNTTYPVTTGPFHPNHFAWQCNMGANGLQYVTGPVWSNCHPMEFSISPPAVRPISDPNMETKQVFDAPPSLLEVNNVDETKQEVSLEKSNGSNHGQRVENEKTFNILIRGRRNRKQTLRMPISLLNKPYNSQSFKVIYSRVIRGSEAPKSSTSLSSQPTATAT
ncbi:unnamed protein product [Lactuca virosa]|uniref:Uncharacterized protein n=1 Tax=Lactuca virosa TaxID=75947 RepID=A0AAU9PCK3_9ASTR|nr:unnamed protein product [Lactuca virosa]